MLRLHLASELLAKLNPSDLRIHRDLVNSESGLLPGWICTLGLSQEDAALLLPPNENPQL